MATTAAALRRLSRSASAIAAREVTGSHDLTIHGCTTSRKLPVPGDKWFWGSRTFDVAGITWRIRYHPATRNTGDDNDGSISLYLERAHPYSYQPSLDDCPVAGFTFSLLDRAGNPVPEHSRSSKGLCGFRPPDKMSHGFEEFIRWKDLEASGCLEDDTFVVRCDMTVIQDSAAAAIEATPPHPAAAAAHAVVVPPSNLHEHLNDLLWRKEGTDVTIDVEGEEFEAHGWLLAARSPVFEEELRAAAATKTSKKKSASASGGAGGVVRRRVEIQGMDPEVFDAMLWFMYTDAWPEMEEEDDVEGLLAAAHWYKLDRLKLMCEERLSRRIDLDTVAATLAVAEKNDCRALKAACVEFISRPGNLKALMETEGFDDIKAHCPSVLWEIVLKQLA